MNRSRLVALLLVIAAILWIGSGQFSDEKEAPQANAAIAPSKPFAVSILPATIEQRSRKLTLSGRTEADVRTMAVARTAGTVTELNVKRGSQVQKNDIIAVLSDEARESNVSKAESRLEQRQKEYDAKRQLVESGNLAKLGLSQVEADLSEAQADLAGARAERDRGVVLAPVTGVVNDVPANLGQSLQPGSPVAEVLALNPMLAVVEISELRLRGIKVGDAADIRLVSGDTHKGIVKFISNSASPQTRTYRVDVSIPNPDNKIPDGVTAEVTLSLVPEPATRVARSALTFSAEGKLGVRIVGSDNRVGFVSVTLVEDLSQYLYVSGIPEGASIIVKGQDFVKEGEIVEPVAAKQS